MRTPLALLNLWHQRVKTLVSIGGVGFALLLVFMQLGFMGAVSTTATNVLEKLKFDFVIRARDYLHLYEPSKIERSWLAEAASVEGIESASPFWITIHNWRKLPNQDQLQLGENFESQYLPIAVMAYEPEKQLLDLSDVQTLIANRKLGTDRDILIDDSTQADYGPLNGQRFTESDEGRETEIGGQTFRIQSSFKLGTGLAANGAVLTNERGFSRLWPWSTGQYCSLGLLTAAPDSKVDSSQLLELLRERVQINAINGTQSPSSQSLSNQPPSKQSNHWFSTSPPQVEASAVTVLTRAEALRREEQRWLWQTPIGLIFQMGVILSLLVGGAIVYMVLSTDVANRLPEYATLLAIGYSRGYLAAIVMTQALVLNAFGFVAAWCAAEALYRVTYAVSNIPLTMVGSRIVAVLLLGIVMCCVSGLLALRKLWKAEPASLF